MRKLSLKETDRDKLLILDSLPSENGVWFVVKESGDLMSQVFISLRQLERIQEWAQAKKDEFYKTNGERFDCRR